MITKLMMFRGRPIISPGDIYEIDGIAYKVITATSEIIGESREGITLSEPVFILEEPTTKERMTMRESELISKLIGGDTEWIGRLRR